MNYIDYLEFISKPVSERIQILKDDISRYRTQSLFYENRLDRYPFIFTLKDYDLVIPELDTPVKSLKRVYMELNDPTEYQIAVNVFGGLEHWTNLTSVAWLSPLIEQWRDELEVKVRSEALLQLRLQSDKSTSAAQFLSKAAWKDRRGRPTKAEKEAIAKREAHIIDEVDELYLRAIN